MATKGRLISAPKSVSKLIFRNKLRVLYYHRINNFNYPLSIDPSIFEKQIRYLTSEYNIITQTEYLRILENRTRIKNGLLITFDDGYKDNYTYAYPILTKYSVPATIFLTTDFIDGKMWMWQDIFRYIINNTPNRRKLIKFGSLEFTLDTEDEAERLNARRTFYAYFKDFPYKKRIEKLKTLATILDVNVPKRPPEKFAPLSWDDIRDMSKHNIEFGAHTCSHEIMSKITSGDGLYEALQSKNRIETELQSGIFTFAYPNGQTDDLSKETRSLLKKCGFKLAFTTIQGMNTISTDRFANNRIAATGTSCDQFVKAVSGLNIIKDLIKNALER